jgi:hypothetical protein
MTDDTRAVSYAQLHVFENKYTELLADVRSKLMAELPALDKVGADALMISALVVRAGHQRYCLPTL